MHHHAIHAILQYIRYLNTRKVSIEERDTFVYINSDNEGGLFLLPSMTSKKSHNEEYLIHTPLLHCVSLFIWYFQCSVYNLVIFPYGRKYPRHPMWWRTPTKIISVRKFLLLSISSVQSRKSFHGKQTFWASKILSLLFQNNICIINSDTFKYWTFWTKIPFLIHESSFSWLMTLTINRKVFWHVTQEDFWLITIVVRMQPNLLSWVILLMDSMSTFDSVFILSINKPTPFAWTTCEFFAWSAANR